jgi:hypothetical protein
MGDSPVGVVRLPLTSCPVLSEHSSSSEAASSSSGIGSFDDSTQPQWHEVEQPRRGRLRLRIQAHEVGELVVI